MKKSIILFLEEKSIALSNILFDLMRIEEIENRHDDKDLYEYYFNRTWIRERDRDIFANDKSVFR